jgi:hypothetical protein
MLHIRKRFFILVRQLKNMKKTISFIIFLNLAIFSFGQLDITLQYQSPSYANWEESVQSRFGNEEQLIDYAIYGGMAYRLYPTDIRLGILPEIGYSYGSGQAVDLSNTFNYSMSEVGIKVAAQLFPFDLYGDCNCPTFGRQNDFFQRAFYLKINAGAQYQRLQVQGMLEDANFAFIAGGGAGLNIALSQLLTLAPEINFHKVFNAKWDGFSELHDRTVANDKSNGNLFNVGLRFSFYFEE